MDKTYAICINLLSVEVEKPHYLQQATVRQYHIARVVVGHK